MVIQARTGHDYSDTPTSYNKNVNGHTPIYKCTNCTSTKSDPQEAHTVHIQIMEMEHTVEHVRFVIIL